MNWPLKWLVAFDKAKAVGPGEAHAVTLTFGEAEMARWVPAPGGFAVVAGDYLLTVVDEKGEMAASLPMTISN